MTGDNGIYRLYRLYPSGHDKVEKRLIARFVIVGGVIHHLEDHDGIIDDILPQGKLTGWGLRRMTEMEHSPYWRLVHENDIEDGLHPDLMDEVEGGESWDDTGRVAADVNHLAKIEPALAQHLKVLRQAAPESAKFLAQKLFGDTMVQGVGNKMAYEDFLTREPHGGVHVLLDGNDFGSINKQWGQSTGDEAIKAMGGAIMRASRANKGKLFRVGGDEFRAHFQTPEHAHAFLRHMRKELEALPPVMGAHRHSVSAGIAASPQDAEQALIQAKNAKKSRGYAPGHAETHAHSLLPGAAGPVQVRPPAEVPQGFQRRTAAPMLGPAFTQPLAASEPEVAELRLRKFEADLAKMAVIHDDPAKPMMVYRIQNDAGTGPYSSRRHLPEETRDLIYARSPVQTPDPFHDFDEDDIDDLCQERHPDQYRFGFLSPKHAEEWFGQDALTALRSNGFTLRQVPARKVWRSTSGRQVFFEPHGPR